MAYEIKPNSGTVFRNKKKQSDTHPDFTGEGIIHGKPTWLNIWERKTKGGDTYFSVAFKEKQATPAKNNTQNDVDDGIPF